MRSVKAFVAGVAALALCGAAVTVSSVAYADASGPAITTDQADYAPGSIVDLTGSGWPAGDSVHLTVDDSDGQTWRYSGDAVADGSGAFEIQFNLPDWFVANYTAVAKDADGVTATRAFTDGNVQGSVLAGTTQVAETLQVTKYFGTSNCTGRFKTQQNITSASGSTPLIGVGGNSTNPQSAGVGAPAQIVVLGHLYAFDHWTVSPPSGAPFDTAANPVCMTASHGSTGLVAHYTDQGPTGKYQQTITFDPIPDTAYGASDFQISATSDSGLAVSLGASGPCTLSSATSPAYVHITGAGTCAITATQPGDPTYLAADPVEQDFLISPSSTGVTVTVTCPTTGQTYTGSALTPCTASALVDGVSHDVTDSIVYDSNVHVGPATATASYSDANHSLKTGQSSFTIVPASVPITMTGSQVYGGQPTFSAAYTLPAGVTSSGSATCSKVSDGTSISPTLPAASYTLLSGSCTGLSLDSTDYVASYVGSTFTVGEAVITATVTGGHTYGGTPAFAQTNDAPAGVTVSGTPSCPATTTALAINSSLAAGTYTIDPGSCEGLTPSDTTNYRISYAGGSYVVTQAQVLVTVTGGQTYGGDWKSFTGAPPAPMPAGVTYEQGTLSCTKLTGNTTIANSLAVGTYTIDPTSCSGDLLSGAGAGNYTIAHAGGAFTITPLSITVGVSGTQVYGSAPTWTPDYTHTGFVNDDTSSVITGTLACLPSSTTLSAGTHSITSCSGLSASNYTIGYDLGSLVVSKKPITANVSGTQVYSGSPTWTATYPAGSFVSPDTSAVVGGTLSCTPVDATLHASATGYDITGCTGLSAYNYAITYGLGKLVVTPKTITVNVTGTQVYGGSPTFSPDFTHTAFANSDDYTVVTGSLTCLSSAIANSSVGSSYTISSCSGLSASDYTIGYSYGTLSVTQRPVNVAVTGTQIYGGPGVTYTPNYTTTDFVNGDSSSVVTNNLSCTTDATATSPVAGTYHVLSCTGLTATNYVITIVPGAFTVTRAPLTVKANDQTITYGDALPNPYTYQITGYVNGEGASALSTLPTCSSGATSGSPAWPYDITCSGAVAANYSFQYVKGTLTIGKKVATIGFTGNLFWSTGSATGTSASVTFQAQVTPASGGSPNLTLAPVVFDYYASNNFTTTPTGTCIPSSPTTAAGVATCTLNLGLDNWTVIARITTNQYFTEASSDPVVLTVYNPATDKFVTGGGWVTDPSGSSANSHGNFGFTARYKNGTTPSGQSVYVYRGADGYNYIVKSNSWQGGGLSFGSNTASFSGKCNVTVIDRSTGLAVSGLGGGGYTYRVDVTDNGSPGSADSYAISVYTSAGVLYHQAGTTGSQLVLGGGNIVVHSAATK